jgi:hypothetical protein
MSGSRQPEPFLETPFSEVRGHFSPDGKWVAYASNESGRLEVYVQSFPAGGKKQQISTSGGDNPRWRRDGSELYYVAGDRSLMAVAMKAGTTIEIGTPTVLFRPDWPTQWTEYDVTADGQRFLIDSRSEDEISSFVVVLNWAEELGQ